MGSPPASTRSRDFWGGWGHVTLKVTPRCPSPPPYGILKGGGRGTNGVCTRVHEIT